MKKNFFDVNCRLIRASLIAQLVKNPPATQETLVRFLGYGITLFTVHRLTGNWEIV